MSDLVAVTYPPERGDAFSTASVLHLAGHLRPEGVAHHDPLVWTRPGLLVGIIDPTGGEGSLESFALSPLPTQAGSIAHVRGRWSEAAGLEVGPDLVGSRTVWYAHDSGVSVASTSLRAVIFALGSFTFDPRPLAWLLPSGNLGPEHSWDERVRQVPPACRVTLFPGRTPELTRDPPTPYSGPGDLAGALREAIGELRPGRSWALALSGGLDSRGLAMLLPRGASTLTWGAGASREDPESDAWVARELADSLELENHFFPLDRDCLTADVVVDRFVERSEGRTDNVRGYVDGLQMWSELRAAGVSGLIRGDQVLGSKRRPTELAVRRGMGHLQWHDVGNLRDLREIPDAWEVDSARMPPRRRGEPVFRWNARVQRGGHYPAALAPLNQIKSSYVAVVNPLLTDDIVRFSFALPDAARRDKRALGEWLASRSPDLPLARRMATRPAADFLERADVVGLMRDALGSEFARTHLPGELRSRISRGLVEMPGHVSTTPATVTSRVRAMVPSRVRRWVAHRDPRVTISPHELAFRVLLAARTSEMLASDAAAGRRAWSSRVVDH